MSLKPKYSLIAATAVAVLIAGCLAVAAIYYLLPATWVGQALHAQIGGGVREAEPWLRADFTMPDDVGRVTLLQRHARPFLAEYERRLCVKLARRDPVEIRLPQNPGSATLINVYLTPVSLAGYTGTVLHLEDRWGRYLVDVETLELIKVDPDVPIAPGAYLGRFDDQGGSLRFVPAVEAGEVPLQRLPTVAHK